MGFRCVFHESDVVTGGDFLQRGHVAGVAENMHGHDGFCTWRDQFFHFTGRNIPGVRVGISEYRNGTGAANGKGRGDHSEIRNNHLIPFAHAQDRQGKMQGHCAVAYGNAVPYAAIVCKSLLKS